MKSGNNFWRIFRFEINFKGNPVTTLDPSASNLVVSDGSRNVNYNACDGLFGRVYFTVTSSKKPSSSSDLRTFSVTNTNTCI